MSRRLLVLAATVLVVLVGAAAAYAFVVRAGPNPARGTIAFVGTYGSCHGKSTGGGKLYLAPAQGGASRPFLPARSGADPSWSPDGRSLAFGSLSCGTRLRSAIAVADAQGRHVRVLTLGPDDGKPAWSPDGRTIAFLRQVGLNNRLYTVPAAGGRAQPLGTVPAVTGVSWAPDGRSLVMSRWWPATKDDEGHVMSTIGPMGLYVIRADGTGLRRITGGSVIDSNPAWSPDGRSIVFIRWHRHDAEMLGGGDWTPDSLYLVRPDGSQAHRLADAFIDPAWSPDGKYVVTPEPEASAGARPELQVGLHVLGAHGLLAGTHFRDWASATPGARAVQPTWKAS